MENLLQELIPHEDEPDPPAQCKSCGVPWADHLGLQGTCAALQRVRALLADWQAVTDATEGLGVACHSARLMISQLQDAIDGKGE